MNHLPRDKIYNSYRCVPSRTLFIFRLRNSAVGNVMKRNGGVYIGMNMLYRLTSVEMVAIQRNGTTFEYLMWTLILCFVQNTRFIFYAVLG